MQFDKLLYTIETLLTDITELAMVQILGKTFLTTKESSRRYGMSEEWFKKRRFNGLAPKFIKIDQGNVYYPKVETDQWFEHQIRMKEGA